MEWGCNEILFYGGIAVMIIVALCAVLSYCILRAKKKHLNERLDSEYGKPNT